ncbi:MAG: BolA family transcriptional regulator [Pseudomonadota bacterium]|nr:BolA family transcriptional regulator [Pseudomonadota bacterium]MDE3037790.1 BolA family transcriptional regulator [Pseudomonadota bacterium]
MGMSAEEIERLVRRALPDAAIEITDLAGDNDHYSISVTSSGFAGKTRVAQHRLVMDAIGGMGTKLHALSVTTKTK